MVYGNYNPAQATRNPYPQMRYWGKHFNPFLYSELLSESDFKEVFVFSRQTIYELRDKYAVPFFQLLGPNGGLR